MKQECARGDRWMVVVVDSLLLMTEKIRGRTTMTDVERRRGVTWSNIQSNPIHTSLIVFRFHMRAKWSEINYYCRRPISSGTLCCPLDSIHCLFLPRPFPHLSGQHYGQGNGSCRLPSLLLNFEVYVPLHRASDGPDNKILSHRLHAHTRLAFLSTSDKPSGQLLSCMCDSKHHSICLFSLPRCREP